MIGEERFGGVWADPVGRDHVIVGVVHPTSDELEKCTSMASELRLTLSVACVEFSRSQLVLFMGLLAEQVGGHPSNPGEITWDASVNRVIVRLQRMDEHLMRDLSASIPEDALRFEFGHPFQVSTLDSL
ncbi:MAG: hypothetical protein ABJA81_02770 [Nocardioidaceae bacterium]